jgi:class 3 adenylate cyclase
MGITKKEALHAIAAQARKRARLDYDKAALLPDYLVRDYLKSQDPTYKRFADFYEARDAKRGGHPDYDFLAQPDNVGNTVEGRITTLFMDLKNFTKYCCFLSPTDVYQAKFASIESTIGVCSLHGGHLHDITGDGVMFFFGGAACNDLDCARHALDAAADAMELLETVVISQYNNRDKYPNIHPKIGVDYGTALWGAYGAPPVFEAKATGFNVDVANKMMGERNSQEVAIGDNLREFLDVKEEEYLEPGWVYKKQMKVEGEEKEISYKTWVFDWRQHLRDRADDDRDLARLGTIKSSVVVTGSRTRLGDAPLA